MPADFGGDAGAVVGDREFEARWFCGDCDGKSNLPASLEGFECVFQECSESCSDLGAIGGELRQVSWQLSESDGCPLLLRGRHMLFENFIEQFRHIKRRQLRRGRMREEHQISEHFERAKGLRVDGLERFAAIRIFFTGQQHLRTGGDVGERVVDLVAQAIGELAEGGEFFALEIGVGESF